MRTELTSSVNTLIMALVATGLWFQSAHAAGPALPRPERRPALDASQTLGPVEGWGENEGQSWSHARHTVKAEVQRYLQSEVPGLDWLPSEEYIRERLIKEPPQPCLEEGRQKKQLVEGRYVKCWSWTPTVSAQDWRDILYRDREQRAGQRMLLLGRLLAGVVAFLAVVAGYIRLDEWTKGYYTGWLRLTALGLLAVTGAGLWWLS